MTDFDEYIRQSEPDRQQRAYAWRTAIGLQAVDGLKPSEYLKDMARRHIEGEMTIDEVREQIKSYYQSKTNREPDDGESRRPTRSLLILRRFCPHAHWILVQMDIFHCTEEYLRGF